MKRYLSSAVCATALLLSCASVDAILAPASAQTDYSVDFDTFHDQLAPYGDWVYSDRWGEVWLPDNVPGDFHPYGTGGHWGYTDDYGWTWVSDYEWGDIPFHYGRWVNDPDNGWLWIPGYVWSPGWVIWRSNGQYTGWMPMPPDEQFLSGGPLAGLSFGGNGIGVSIDFNNTNNYYGYSQWYGSDYGQDQFAANWVFVGTGHISDRDYSRYEAPSGNYTTIIRNTTNITNYTVVNNYIVNKSVNVQAFEKASGHPVQKLAIADVIHKPQLITHMDAGRTIQTKMRAEMPRGTGRVGSAPKPSPQVVQSLSQKVATHNGKQPANLFTRETVAKAPLAKAPPAAGPESATPRTMERHGNEAAPAGNGPSPGGIPPSATTPKNPVRSNATTTPGGTSEHPAEEDKTHTRPEPSTSGPSTVTPAHGTTNMEQPGVNTDHERLDHHATPTETTPPSAPSRGNGGMERPGTDATGAPQNLQRAPTHRERAPSSMTETPPGGSSGSMGRPANSAAHPDRVPATRAPATTTAPSKPSGDQPGEKKPKHDEPDKPQ